MRRFLFLIVFCAFAAFSGAHAEQRSLPIPVDSHVPDLNYFQQHVYYLLDATLEDKAPLPHLSGQGSLFYTNNSSDTLSEVYFHLYWNLFTHGSYGERSPNRDHGDDDSYGLEGITIKKFGQQLVSGNEDNTSQIEVDNTILHLRLDHPILPGEQRVFTFTWVGELPFYGIRSTWGYHDNGARNFATAQWYPQICVYDEHGWHPDQYIGMGEFYTDYGMFDVTLHLPKSLSTVITTGWQTNQEILSPEVREHLQFARTHPDSLVHVADNGLKAVDRTGNDTLITWKFHADSVRDFAWVADEAYIWDVIYKNGTMHNALYWQNSRAFWGKDAARIATHTIQFDSKLAGQYIYPNLFMCETYEGGMEYPGIVFIGPYSRGGPEHYPENTMMHEIGHEWYPMMMGSNETDYGYMDEGFNTFITTLVQEAWYGRYNNSVDPGLGFNDDERTANYRTAWYDQESGFADPPETKADMFLDYHEYADATYPKTSTIFFMLRYTMGDSAFADFLHSYYDRWLMKHPYPDDLRVVAEEVDRKEGDTSRVRARGDLRWFFDEWFRKSWKLDYAISDFSTKGDAASVTINRLERGVMPLDLVFTFEDGSKEQRWIAVDDWLRTVAVARTYSYTFAKHPVSVVINPSNELFESNRLNNFNGWIPPLDVSLVPKLLGDSKPVDAYAIRSAPFAAAQTYGWTLLGSYLERSDRLALGLRVNAPAGGAPVLPGGVLQYHTILDAFSPLTSIDISGASVGRYQYGGFQFNHIFEGPVGEWPHHTFVVDYDLSRATPTALPLNRSEVGYTFAVRNSFTAFSTAIDMEAGLGDPRTTYTKLSGAINFRQEIGPSWNMFLRVFGGTEQPSNGLDLPLETEFRLGSPSRLQSYIDDYTSNLGTDEGTKIRNEAQSGPLVRGYMLEGNPFGRVAASAQFELSNSTLFPFGFLRALPFIGALFQYTGFTAFGDAGFISDRATKNLHDLMRYDFGPGLRILPGRYLWRSFGVDLDRTEIQLDFPIYLSSVQQGTRYKFRQELFLRQNF